MIALLFTELSFMPPSVDSAQNTAVTPMGRHLLVDYWHCNPALLDDKEALVQILTMAAQAAGATVMSIRSHTFDNQGVTAVAILAESHISIHTWPENGYAGVDVYTCGTCDPMQAHHSICKALSAKRAECVEMIRGREHSQQSIILGARNAEPHFGLEDDNSWFMESSVPGKRNGNVRHGFSIDKLVYNAKTAFQDCLIFDAPVYGRVLVLDGIVQFSTSDEHIYHEMIVHPAMFLHPKPKRVVIIGGGDGGTLREVLRHNPEEVLMIDIDEAIINAAAKYLPSLNNGGFSDPRVKFVFEDAAEALRRYRNAFDVAIIDCNDAVGTSAKLFESRFYQTLTEALDENGICAIQAGSMLDEEFLIETRKLAETHIGSTVGFKLTMPSYHCGEYVFFVASKVVEPHCPSVEKLSELQANRGVKTRHWSPSMHHAAQVLPPNSSLW